MKTIHCIFRFRSLIWLATYLLFWNLPANAQIFYVKADATGANNGSSWEDAFTDLQDALSAAGSGQQIWVAAGTYKPTDGTDRYATFNLRTGVGVYGGFAGFERYRYRRKWYLHETVLSGNIGSSSFGDNCYHVITSIIGDSLTILDGFTVTGGLANGLSNEKFGGGIYNSSSGPVMRNLIITGNQAVGGGGMFNNSGSTPVLTNVLFVDNIADHGGAMYNSRSSPEMINVAFVSNSGGGSGAISNSGQSASPSYPEVTNSILWNNSTDGGPGILNRSYTNTIIQYSLVEGSGGSGAGWNPDAGTDGGHNIDGDPLLVDIGALNARLSLGSPAIDAGDSSAPYLPEVDIRGNPRITGATVDMGVYEFFCTAGSILYVDADAVGIEDGSSWDKAYTTLVEAMAVACSNISEIWVAEGVYTPTGGNDRRRSFQLQNGLAIYGGFSGTESARNERVLENHSTILSGEIWGAEPMDNSYHVVTGSGTDSTAVIDGFVVTAGFADGAYPEDRGAGMYNDGGSPLVRNVIFSGHWALISGGGMSNFLNSNPIITNTVFTGNTVITSGGGMSNMLSHPVLTNVTFQGNSAVTEGGGMCNTGSNPLIVNTILWGNTASSGAQISNGSGSAPLISYSLVEGSGGSGAGWDPAVGTDGGGNLDEDPLFVNDAGGDLHLGEGSPAANAGDNNAPYLPAQDLDGNPRIIGLVVDMGAYESSEATSIGEPEWSPPIDAPIVRSAYPNPFNPVVTVAFDLERDRYVQISIYDVRGRFIRRLLNDIRAKGPNRVVWDSMDESGKRVASGVYLIRFQSEGWKDTRKVVLLK